LISLVTRSLRHVSEAKIPEATVFEARPDAVSELAAGPVDSQLYSICAVDIWSYRPSHSSSNCLPGVSLRGSITRHSVLLCKDETTPKLFFRTWAMTGIIYSALLWENMDVLTACYADSIMARDIDPRSG
jgi:hypothetical protein